MTATRSEISEKPFLFFIETEYHWTTRRNLLVRRKRICWQDRSGTSLWDGRVYKQKEKIQEVEWIDEFASTSCSSDGECQDEQRRASFRVVYFRWVKQIPWKSVGYFWYTLFPSDVKLFMCAHEPRYRLPPKQHTVLNQHGGSDSTFRMRHGYEPQFLYLHLFVRSYLKRFISK